MYIKQFLLTSLLGIGLLGPHLTAAGGLSNHGRASSTHVSAAVSEGLAASASLAAGAVAVPLLSAGAVGRVSSDIGKDLAEIAEIPIGKPLPLELRSAPAPESPSEALRGRVGQ